MRDPAAFTAPALPENIAWQSGSCRISLITPRLVRFEYAADGRFEDRRTLAVEHRALRPVPFSRNREGDRIRIDTGALRIELLADEQPLSRSNLRCRFELNGRSVTFFPGEADPDNLRGTARTLDGYNGSCFAWQGATGPELSLCAGFLSRSGWSCIRDEAGPVLDAGHRRSWIRSREPGERQDFYLLAYGHDYVGCLADAAQVFGRQPLPPRYTLGYWWSRFWAYSDAELRQLVRDFRERHIPLDVLVIDMDWHLEGWTGYTWNRELFPDPGGLLKFLHQQGCRVTLNLHPADGVGRHEAQFRALARALKAPAGTDRIPFEIDREEFMEQYFRLLHRPEEERGVDFWWLDWQQKTNSTMPGLDALPWLNQLHWEDLEQAHPERRPLILSRFGGYGAGRYNLGFSGDTYNTWASLKYQFYFTATAANVLFGYWSHDIGGHLPGDTEPELYTRWVQFGVYSPILRTHTGRNPKAERRFWKFPEPYATVLIDYVRRRHELVPYIYSENRKAYDTGVSLCRPMYYACPESDAAYDVRGQYLFGESILAAPIAAPLEPETGRVRHTVWLPDGVWFALAENREVAGGRRYTADYGLADVPLFVRPGTVIPGRFGEGSLEEPCYRRLLLKIYGGTGGEYVLYEDDGYSPDYRRGGFAEVLMRHGKTGAVRTIQVRHLRGTYPGWEPVRQLKVELYGVAAPSRVRRNGRVFRNWSWGDGVLTLNPTRVDLDAGVEFELED